MTESFNSTITQKELPEYPTIDGSVEVPVEVLFTENSVGMTETIPGEYQPGDFVYLTVERCVKDTLHQVLSSADACPANKEIGETKEQSAPTGDPLSTIDCGMPTTNGIECAAALQSACLLGAHPVEETDNGAQTYCVQPTFVCGVRSEPEADKCGQSAALTDCKCCQSVMTPSCVSGTVELDDETSMSSGDLDTACLMSECDAVQMCEDVSTETHKCQCFGELFMADLVCSSSDGSHPNVQCHDSVKAGCHKTNKKSGTDADLLELASMVEDTASVSCHSSVSYVGDQMKKIDDTDYPGNCCACMAGESAVNQPCTGTSCTECAACECTVVQDADDTMLQSSTNTCLTAVVTKEPPGLLQSLQPTDQNNLSLGSMYKCCSLVSGLGGSVGYKLGLSCCMNAFMVACDAYNLYHLCTRFTEMFEGFNTGSTGLSVSHVYANSPGPTEVLHCRAADGKVIDQTDRTMVDEEEDYATVLVNMFTDFKDGLPTETDENGESTYFKCTAVCMCDPDGLPGVLVERSALDADHTDALLCQSSLAVVMSTLPSEYDDVKCMSTGVNTQCQVAFSTYVYVLPAGMGTESCVVSDLGETTLVYEDGMAAEADVVYAAADGVKGFECHDSFKHECLNQSIRTNYCLTAYAGDQAKKGQFSVDGFLTDNLESVSGVNSIAVHTLREGHNHEDGTTALECAAQQDSSILANTLCYETDVCDMKSGFEETI